MNGTVQEQQFFDLAATRGLKPVGTHHADNTLRRIAGFFSRSLLREETAGRPSLLQGTDPRARLLVALFFLISVSLARSIPVLLAHAVLPIVAMALSRIRVKEVLGAGLLMALVFSVLMAAPAALNVFAGGQALLPFYSRDQEWHYGPYLLPRIIGVSREGLLTAVTLLLRVLSSVAAMLWLTLSTRWLDLLRALRFLHLPPMFVQVAGMTVRYVHAFHRQSEEMHLGKKSRSVCRSSIAAEQAWVGARIANSWDRSLHLMEEVNDAMVARGFTGEARFPRSSRLMARDWLFLAAVLLLCVAAHAVGYVARLRT
ncbi:MAG TPA: cobalt ECF transporter T component CbiQ [archaeon]|nr:cobalt ECF transporter T component CbiQ [archaeon]